ncbi:GHKL domain-containing protein [bacterium]|nr:GHKL domain-containing protein [bacterium]
MKLAQTRKANVLYDDIRKEKAVFFDKIINLKGMPLSTFVKDYTFWDDMVVFLGTGDETWAQENIDTALETFSADAAWVFKKDYSMIYHVNDIEACNLKNFPIHFSLWKRLFEKDRFCHFFCQIPQGLLEIRGATIHPTSDSERQTDPKGFFFAAKLWTEEYLKDIAKLTGSNVALADNADNLENEGFNSIGKGKGLISFSKELLQWDKNPLNFIKVGIKSKVINEINKGSNMLLLSAIILELSIFLILTLLLLIWVSRPLHLISKCLGSENISIIDSLQENKTEFGNIARLIKGFFTQKKELADARDALEEKVKERTAELTCANKALEHEISLRKKEEAEKERVWSMLIQSEKMAILGQMGGILAHEIRNPLTVINGYAELILMNDNKNGNGREVFKAIAEESKRCITFLEQILNFIRKGKVDKENVDLNGLINNTKPLIEAKAKASSVNLHTDLSFGLPVISANPSQIQQLVINLCNNAIDAMPKGGVLYLRTKLLENNGASNAEIQIKDNGAGISKEIQENIFEPFFTTKEAGKGTGLGLALVNDIVQKHNGSISFESEPGIGTTFKILLPVNGSAS